MTNMGKYRKLSVIAITIMAVAWLLALTALWNSIRNIEVKYEGWVVMFMILVLCAGVFLFFAAFQYTDYSRIDEIKRKAYEEGKSVIVQDMERKRKTEAEQRNEAEAVQTVVNNILSGISGVRSANSLCNKLLAALAKELQYVQGIMYVHNSAEGLYAPAGEFAITDRKPEPFKEGDGIPGQVAESKTPTVLYDIPENYFKVSSGLGTAHPKYLVVVPVIFEEKCIAVLELAAFKKHDDLTGSILEKVLTEAGQKLNKYINA